MLLEHAAEHSPFHARRLRGLHPERLELTDLARLPVMTKSQTMASFDDVVTDRRLSRRLVERHLAASPHEPGLLLDQYVCLASGGSSGLRGVFVQTLGAAGRTVVAIDDDYDRAATAGLLVAQPAGRGPNCPPNGVMPAPQATGHRPAGQVGRAQRQRLFLDCNSEPVETGAAAGFTGDR